MSSSQPYGTAIIRLFGLLQPSSPKQTARFRFLAARTAPSGRVPKCPLPRQSVSDHRKYTPPDALLSSCYRQPLAGRSILFEAAKRLAIGHGSECTFLVSLVSHHAGSRGSVFASRHSPRNVFELWHWGKKKRRQFRDLAGDRSVRTSSTVGDREEPVRFWRFWSLADSGPPSRAFTVYRHRQRGTRR